MKDLALVEARSFKLEHFSDTTEKKPADQPPIFLPIYRSPLPRQILSFLQISSYYSYSLFIFLWHILSIYSFGSFGICKTKSILNFRKEADLDYFKTWKSEIDCSVWVSFWSPPNLSKSFIAKIIFETFLCLFKDKFIFTKEFRNILKLIESEKFAS